MQRQITNACLPAARKPPKWSIPESYQGIHMRSRLEVRYARFFDQHHMAWAYEPEGFHILGVRYLPHFYLPEVHTIVEVKGVLDPIDVAKLAALVPAAARQGVLTILAEPGEPVRFRLCRPTPEMESIAVSDPAYAEVCSWEFRPQCDVSSDAALVRCATCGRWYFIDSSMSWKCTGCGAYDGNMTFDLVHPGSPGWSCHDCPDCGERAA
ncbi:MAG: hypothetical protein GX630_09525 [Actinobacteria bacterium]|nr:hypothetical protein [Actinomycetota bacterium]